MPRFCINPFDLCVITSILLALVNAIVFLLCDWSRAEIGHFRGWSRSGQSYRGWVWYPASSVHLWARRCRAAPFCDVVVFEVLLIVIWLVLHAQLSMRGSLECSCAGELEEDQLEEKVKKDV